VDTISEKESFIQIIKENKRIIYKVIYSYCKDSEDRKDLEQEIIIQLWKSLKSYDEKYKLSTWIYKIAMNVAISHYRKDLKRHTNSTTLDEAIFQIDEEDSTEEQKSQSELLYRFINQLDPLCKAIMILYLDDKSYKDISEIIGITETNVGTKINRIKKQLKEWFLPLNN